MFICFFLKQDSSCNHALQWNYFAISFAVVVTTKIKPKMFWFCCRCRAMLCKRGLCRHAVSVRLSAMFVNSVQTNKYIFIFSSSCSPHHGSFCVLNVVAIFRRGTLYITGASNAGMVGTNSCWLSIDDCWTYEQQLWQSTMQFITQSATQQWSYIYHSLHLQHARTRWREENRT